MNKTLSILLVVVAIVVAGYLLLRNRSKDSVLPPNVVPDDTLGGGQPAPAAGDGTTPGNNANSPRLVTFDDFAAMRGIGNDGRRMNTGGARRLIDPLYNATGFMVRQGADLSRFTVGEFVRVRAAINNLNPHFDTGAMEIKAIIPALPGHGTQVRGTWVVTNAGWRNGSTGPERGTLEIL